MLTYSHTCIRVQTNWFDETEYTLYVGGCREDFWIARHDQMVNVIGMCSNRCRQPFRDYD